MTFFLIFTLLFCSGSAFITKIEDAKCVTKAFPPEGNLVPTYVINLDLPPEKRYTTLMQDKHIEMKALLAVIKAFLQPVFNGKLFEFIDEAFPFIAARLPPPFAGEVQGIATDSGMKLGEVALYNIFYEIFTVCTSIVAQDQAGRLYHARNMDFGLFLGWDVKNHTWAVTEALRPLVVKLDYQRANQTIFQSISFAGYVGVLTAIKPEAFTVTVNERFTKRPGILDLIKWFLEDSERHFVGFLSRTVMENATSYTQAQKLLAKTPTLAPAYYIIGGLNPGEGCVLTRDQRKVDIWPLGVSTPSQPDTWYLLQTNFDHWKKPPFFDNRRMPGILCMQKMGQANLTLPGLFNVLSSPPVFNKLTTYTALMQVDQGLVKAWIQDCTDPSCPPW